MRKVFADANYWIGLLNPRDQLHPIALAASRKLGKTRLVTSEMVLVEVLNSLAEYTSLRASIIAVVDAISANPNTEIVPQTAILFRDAFEFYRTHQDKEWGLTDCSSFMIMRQRGLTEALTFDPAIPALLKIHIQSTHYKRYGLTSFGFFRNIGNPNFSGAMRS